MKDDITPLLPQDNTGEKYDSYYSGPSSIYDDLYGGNVIPRDRWVIREAALKNIANITADTQGERVLRIADYGCGDGRYFQVITPIARELKNSNIKVELIGYDPSKVGLAKFEEKIITAEFTKIAGCGYRDIVAETGGTQGYVSSVYQSDKDNLQVRLIHGHVDDHLDHIASLIEPVQLTLCMFGVLSHIPGKRNRTNLLTMLGNITREGTVILTLPGAGILQKQQELFKTLREEGYSPQRLAEAREDGDLYYTRHLKDGSDIEIFYHIYKDANEIREDLALSGLLPKHGIMVQKILHETTLTASPTLAKIDEFVSWAVPSYFADYVAGYYLVVAERAMELKRLPFTEQVTKSRNDNHGHAR